MVTISQIEFEDRISCYQMTNDQISLVITADVGPRIISFGFNRGPNEFAVLRDESGPSGSEAFRFYGGHRLWHAPESMPRTYFPDNDPVQVEYQEGRLRASGSIERTTSIQKQLEITMADDAPRVRVAHQLTNHGLWTVELAPWALTMCAPGGVGIAPLPTQGDHSTNLLPQTSISLWAYTRMADPRWMWGDSCIMLRQDKQLHTPQKAGLYTEDGWIAYANNGHLFVKTFDVVRYAVYPDRGCNVELFTNDVFLEIETLGPLTRLEPGASVEHVEEWHLLDEMPPLETEEDIHSNVRPRVEMILQGRMS